MRRVTPLVCALISFACSSALYAGDSPAGLKENLDLPYSSSAGGEDEEERAAEAFIFYGERFEGLGIFFCCATGGFCET